MNILQKGVFGLCGVIVFGMVGCSATPIDSTSSALTSQAYTAKMSCYDRLRTRDIQLSAMMSKIPKEQVGLVFVLQQMQENNKSLMAIATGNSADPCSSGTNAFDVQIAEVKAKNHALEKVGGDVVGGIKWVAGAVAVTNIASDLSDGGTTSTSSTTVTGDGNTMDSYKASTGSAMVTDNALSEGASLSTTPSTTDDNSINDDHSIDDHQIDDHTTTAEPYVYIE